MNVPPVVTDVVGDSMSHLLTLSFNVIRIDWLLQTHTHLDTHTTHEITCPVRHLGVCVRAGNRLAIARVHL